jgi:hypothetical protein
MSESIVRNPFVATREATGKSSTNPRREFIKASFQQCIVSGIKHTLPAEPFPAMGKGYCDETSENQDAPT